MGHREVRPVPLEWQHPIEGEPYSNGSPRYRPLFSRADLHYKTEFYADNPEYAGDWEYDPADFMPEMAEGTPYGFQLYETTTEGTPVSPVFPSLQELAAWCEDGATVFASFKWTRDQWLASFEADSLGTDSLLTVGPAGIGPLGGQQ